MNKSQQATGAITRIAMLSAAATVLYFLEFPLPLMPPWLKLDLAMLPAMVAALGMGALPGVCVIILMNILHLFRSTSAGIGEFANALIGCALALPVAFIARPTLKSGRIWLSFVVGIIAMTAVAALANMYILLPLYLKTMQLGDLMGAAASGNPAIVDIRTYITLAVLPFNVIKGVLVCALSYPIFKGVRKVL